MPKDRILHANFFDDPDVGALTRDERLLLAGMFSACADDEGRLLAEPGYLRKVVFGYDDDVTRAQVAAWRDHIVATCRNVVLYHADGQAYCYLTNFQVYQKIRYIVPSRLPAPPDLPPQPAEPVTVTPEPVEDCGTFPQSSANSGHIPQSAEVSRRVGMSRVGLGSESRAPTREADPAITTEREPGEAIRPGKNTPRPIKQTPLPKPYPLTEEMRVWARQETPDLANVDAEHGKFCGYYHARGDSERRADWRPEWQAWMYRAVTDFKPRGSPALRALPAGPPRESLNGRRHDAGTA